MNRFFIIKAIINIMGKDENGSFSGKTVLLFGPHVLLHNYKECSIFSNPKVIPYKLIQVNFIKQTKNME